jgi:hypothetical protein
MRGPIISIACILISANSYAATKPVKSTAQTKWSVTTKKDAMTDVISVSATLPGDKGLLALSCKSGDIAGIRVLVGSDVPISSDVVRVRQIMYRIDEAEPTKDNWAYGGQAAMITVSKKASNFINGLINHKMLLVRMYDYSYRSFDINFDISGGDVATKQMMAGCGLL